MKIKQKDIFQYQAQRKIAQEYLTVGSTCDLSTYRALERASELIPDHATLLPKTLNDFLLPFFLGQHLRPSTSESLSLFPISFSFANLASLPLLGSLHCREARDNISPIPQSILLQVRICQRELLAQDLEERKKSHYFVEAIVVRLVVIWFPWPTIDSLPVANAEMISTRRTVVSVQKRAQPCIQISKVCIVILLLRLSKTSLTL